MERTLELLVSQSTIAATVERLAHALDHDYGTTSPVLVGILKGSFIFLSDLVRAMQIPIRSIEFLCLSSYGSATVSSGQVSIQMEVSEDAICNQSVIIVEDIVDTGITTVAAMDYLGRFQPASLKLCALLDKPARRCVPVAIDYLGLSVPDCFVVGYGIDFDQQYRQLPAIYRLGE